MVPLFASWYAISLLEFPMCFLTFCIVIVYLVHRIWWTTVEISCLLGVVVLELEVANVIVN